MAIGPRQDATDNNQLFFTWAIISYLEEYEIEVLSTVLPRGKHRVWAQPSLPQGHPGQARVVRFKGAHILYWTACLSVTFKLDCWTRTLLSYM
jgi:hypothetical protein